MKKLITIVITIFSLQMSAQCWQSISAGENNSLAIRNDGTLWIWGSTMLTNIGLVNTPTQVGTASNWTKISAGYGSASYAIKADGTLWAWGWNTYGQIGIGNYSDFVTSLSQVGTANNWVSVSAGTTHCLALKADGTIWTWGRNNYGQLGNNGNSNKNIPIQVGTANNWQSIAAGGHFCLALKSDGTLWSWGDNVAGALGDGTTTQRNVPTQIGTATNWQKIEGGYYHSTAIKSDGTLWAWGSNANGQLGDGTTTGRKIPTQVGSASNWQNVSAGYSFTYAIKNDHTLWSWGANNSGQLGNGTNGATNSLLPTQVGTSSDTFAVSAGESHVLEKNSDGFLRATGKNALGQLGDGTAIDKNSLTSIACSNLSNEEFTSSTALKTFPNPVSDVLNISSEQEIDHLSIHTLLGHEIFKKAVRSNNATIDVSNLNAGIYIVQVYYNQTMQTIKIIKK